MWKLHGYFNSASTNGILASNITFSLFFVLIHDISNLVMGYLCMQNQCVVLEPVFKREMEMTRKHLVELKQVIAGFHSTVACLMLVL